MRQFQSFQQLIKRLAGKIGALGGHLVAHALAPDNQPAFEPADDNHRQDDVLVFVSLELAAQPLGGFPDFGSKVVELCFIECEGHAVGYSEEFGYPRMARLTDNRGIGVQFP